MAASAEGGSTATTTSSSSRKKPPQKKKKKAVIQMPRAAGEVSQDTDTGTAARAHTDADDNVASEKKSDGKRGGGAGFGVRSYLHHFYESMTVRNPDEFEDLPQGGKQHYLFTGRSGKDSKRGRCSTSLMWKIGIWGGINLLVFGVIAILVGYLVPPHNVVVELSGSKEVIDRQAQKFNYNLDMCKLVGLIIFCIGGSLLAVSVLFPSFLYGYCGEGGGADAYLVTTNESVSEEPPFKVTISTDVEDEAAGGPRSPTDVQVPATEKKKSVQPKRAPKEAMMTSGDGAINISNGGSM